MSTPQQTIHFQLRRCRRRDRTTRRRGSSSECGRRTGRRRSVCCPLFGLEHSADRPQRPAADGAARVLSGRQQGGGDGLPPTVAGWCQCICQPLHTSPSQARQNKNKAVTISNTCHARKGGGRGRGVGPLGLGSGGSGGGGPPHSRAGGGGREGGGGAPPHWKGCAGGRGGENAVPSGGCSSCRLTRACDLRGVCGGRAERQRRGSCRAQYGEELASAG